MPPTTPRPTRGKTVGRAIIKSFVHDYMHGKEPDYKPLYTQAQFDRMVQGLKNEHEHSVYLRYIAIYNGLVEELVRAQGYYHQAQNGFLRLDHALLDAYRAEVQSAQLALMQEDLQQLLPLAASEVTRVSSVHVASLQSLFEGFLYIENNADFQSDLRLDYGALLLPALRGLLAYNRLMEIVAQVLEMDEILFLRLNLDELSRGLALYNGAIQRALDTLYGTEEEIRRKAAVLGTYFQSIFLENYAPDESTVLAVYEVLKNPANHQTGVVQHLLIRLLEERA